MKIRFRVGDTEAEGQARDLSTLGTFVVTPQPGIQADQAGIVVLLETGSQRLKLAGEVVRVTAEGFAVAFEALPTETLERLVALLHPDRTPSEQPAPARSGLDELAFAIQGEDWQPPVSEPVLHQWRPEKDLTRPPAASATRSGWEGLPTLAPIPPGQEVQVEPPAQAARAADRMPSPEEKAQQLLAGGAQPAAPKAGGPVQTPAASARPAAQAQPADQRKTERVERSIPVSFENLTGLIKEFTHNISYGGMFVYAHQPQRENTQTAVTLIHPVHGERLTLLAKVVHAGQAPTPDPAGGQPRYGLGLEFSLPLDELKRILADFIGSHQRSDGGLPTAQVIVDARQVLERGRRSRQALLGVTDRAGPDEVRRAYFNLVDRFHPDRYFGKVSEADRKLLAELFRLLTKAYEDLTA